MLAIAPPATLFPILYAFRPWYRSLIGRALMTHSVGLALLIDISLLCGRRSRSSPPTTR